MEVSPSGGVVAARCREHGWAWQEGGGWWVVEVVDPLVGQWYGCWETLHEKNLRTHKIYQGDA